MSNPCEETAGFLFKHACRTEAPTNCAECEKAICKKHTKQVGEFRVCVACAKLMLEEEAAKSQPKRAPGAREDAGRSRRRYSGYDDDPYLYGYSYYDGYGSYRHGHWGHDHYSSYDDHDGSDFTEADGQSFQVEKDEGFEQDMGGS
jgi:hypothetical protein